MKVPLEWLKAYVPVRLDPEALAQRLTMAGLEVTAIERINGEPVLHFEITPNRADCLSMVGIAREVAAITGTKLKLPHVPQGKSRKHQTPSPELRTKLVIRIEDRKGCARYIGRLIEGVRIGPSPAWMQRRLAACGLRPINNVVDVTNYVLLEYGQPLHAFDYDRLASGTILVRRAKPNEPLTALDGVSRQLPAETLVIADASRAVAIAGVMGGVGSEVTEQTRRVVLESALFDPITVRRTARKLGLTTESSYRFERGVDPVAVDTASSRASSLITELAGGTERAVCDVGMKPSTRPAILLEPPRVARWLGTPVSTSAIRTTLGRLSCRVVSAGTGGRLRVTPPSFRRDLLQDVDLIEELARVIGYDQIPSSVPTSAMRSGLTDPSRRYEAVRFLRGLCASLGLSELMSWALVSEQDLASLGIREGLLRIANPLSADRSVLRPTLLLGALAAVRRNLAQGLAGLRGFEVGNVFRKAQLPIETTQLGIVLSGTWERTWQANLSSGFFRLKGVVEQLVERTCGKTIEARAERIAWAQSGQYAVLRLEGQPLGVMGEVSPQVCEAFDIAQRVWYAELSVDTLLAARRGASTVTPLNPFPPVKRDLSLILDDRTAFANILQTIREVGSKWLERAELIDRYTGRQVAPAKHSLTFSLTYRDPSRTLTAAEVDEFHRTIGEALVQRFGAQLR